MNKQMPKDLESDSIEESDIVAVWYPDAGEWYGVQRKYLVKTCSDEDEDEDE